MRVSVGEGRNLKPPFPRCKNHPLTSRTRSSHHRKHPEADGPYTTCTEGKPSWVTAAKRTSTTVVADPKSSPASLVRKSFRIRGSMLRCLGLNVFWDGDDDDHTTNNPATGRTSTMTTNDKRPTATTTTAIGSGSGWRSLQRLSGQLNLKTVLNSRFQ